MLNFHPEVIAFLFAEGANPDLQKNEYGASVLAGLCYVDKIECVRLLLEYGANPNLGRQETLETPWQHALANDASEDLIDLLTEHGADVNAKTKPGISSYNFYGETPTQGETPLHRAAAYASLEVIQRLLAAGADPRITDANGHTPHQWAGWHRRPKVLVEHLAIL